MLTLSSAGKTLSNGEMLFENVSLRIERGSSLALVGRSGSGKSTLLGALGLMDRFDAGTYSLDNIEVNTASAASRDKLRRNSIGFIFQRFSLISHISVLENVMVPLRHAGGSKVSEMRTRARDALDAVEMGRHVKKLPRQLSGGEQQRVGIARALVKRPSLILADEPTGSLDDASGWHVMELLLSNIAELNAALILVTHDSHIATLMDRTLLLKDHTLLPMHSAKIRRGPARHSAGI